MEYPLNKTELRDFVNNLVAENAVIRPKNPYEVADMVKKIKGKTFAIDMYSLLIANETDLQIKSGYQTILDYVNQD